MGAAIEKEIANELFLSWVFVFLTSCRRLSYQQVLTEFFFERDMSQIRPILQWPLQKRYLELDYDVIVFLHEQRTEKRRQRMQPEFDLLNVLFLHQFYSLGGKLGPKRYLTSKLGEYIQRLHAEPSRILFDFIWFVRRRVASQRVDHCGGTKAKMEISKGILWIVPIC